MIMKIIDNFAHRGARSLAPENTMPAIHKAWEIGTQGVEVDVRVSRDGLIVLHHDQTLKRTTDVADTYPDRSAHPLSTFSFTELQELDAGSWFIATDPFAQIKAGNLSPAEIDNIPHCRIPLLSELLEFIMDKEWRINLELKEASAPMQQFPLVEAVLALIREAQVDANKIIISSFEHNYLRVVKRLAPDIEINALIGQNALEKNNWDDYEFRIYNANYAYITKEQILAAKKKDCKVNLYTVNKRSDMKRFINWGVDALITDFPQHLQHLLQNG